MSLAFLHWLQSTALAVAVAKSNHLVGAGLQIAHIAGLVLLLASALLIDLRALGLVLRGESLAELSAQTARLPWLGLALAAGSGALIFMASAVRYAANAAFDLKILLLLAAVALQLAAQHTWLRNGGGTPAIVRGAAIASLLLWFAVAGAGRAIGYV